MTLPQKIYNKINDLKSKITQKTQTEYTTLAEAVDDLISKGGGESADYVAHLKSTTTTSFYEIQNYNVVSTKSNESPTFKGNVTITIVDN